MLVRSEFRNLDDWRSRLGEVQVLHMLGKACSTPLFALHDEDVLEYLHIGAGKDGREAG
ncbi:MAG: hypothetical protein RBS35_01440 [Azonexus sp.]|uniref:hypothetical protein n=1 Tax=Zoogloea oleivorans TaxID=1552750 RepID=UPI0016527484|nr:hypothetical protein [Zoogloea oleivorans]MDX9943433.1 hypothetical protein [Azonexus sp.]